MGYTVWISCVNDTPLGEVWLAVSERGLAAVEIGAEREAFVRGLARRGFQPVGEDSVRTANASSQLREYLDGQRRDFDLPIDWRGMGEFQRQVLQRVADVPYGQRTTYGELARQLGRPRAARAVGRANGSNPMPLVIPCHRVLGSDGGLHGYGAPGGIETKAWLLRLEGWK